jgi:hypothetical protein
MLVNNGSLLSNFMEHFIDNVRIQWKSVALSITMKLLKSDTVVHVLVACTEKCLNDVLWDLQRSISLVQIFGRTLIVTTINDLLHTHG